MKKLRDYQINLLNNTRKAMQDGYKAPCIVSPCGSGKSVVIAELARLTTMKDNRVLFLVHRKELISQIKKSFRDQGVVMPNVDLMMVQTAVRRLDKLRKPSLIITDENHHSLANTYRKIYDHFPDAYRVGFTATPIRLNGGGLGDVNDILIEGLTVKELIALGHLAPYKYYAPSVVDTSGLHTRRGEFVAKEVDELFSSKTIFGNVINHYKKLAMGKQAILYAPNVAKSIQIARAFNKENIIAEHIDAKTPAEERTKIINRFRSGEIQVLCNVELISEGFDVPDCEVVILLRPTQSYGLFIQQSMRSMRYKPGKTAIIIDHVGNVHRHGLPDKEMTWSLNPQKETKAVKDPTSVKQCPECFFIVPSATAICPDCGHEFKQEVEYKEVETELEEYNQEITLDYRSPRDCKNMSELYSLAKNLGYKPGWAFYQGKLLGYIGG